MSSLPHNDSPHRDLKPPTADTVLLVWLFDVLQPMKRSRVKQLLQQGCVHVNGTPTTQHNHPLKPGDRVTLSRLGTAKSNSLRDANVHIVFEDEHLVAIDKPTGLLTVATESERMDTAFVRLKQHLETTRAGRPFVVHRLDRETSGLLLFGKSVAVRDYLQSNWDSVSKTYLAIVEGTPAKPDGVIEGFLLEGRDLRVRVSQDVAGAKWAVTGYRVVSRRGRFTLVEVELETGRKHQIRVHLASIGCPVIGDSGYGAQTNPVRRLGLHAWKLAFDHPQSGKRLELESPLPDVLRNVVDAR